MIYPMLSLLIAALVAIPKTLVLAQDNTSFIDYGIGVIFVYEQNETTWAEYPSCQTLVPPAGCLTSDGQFSWNYCGSYVSHGNGTITIQQNGNNDTWLDVYHNETVDNIFIGTDSAAEGGDTESIPVWTYVGENDEGIPPDLLVVQSPDGEHSAGPLWYLDNAQDNDFDLAAEETEAYHVGAFSLCFVRFWDGDDE
ncbi:hypothetical protein BDV19DRAFT_393630 [Aspergillus venezuelensis]